MTSTTFFFVFIPLLAVILLAVNLIFAPHNPYQEKDSVFECGFHSFLGQNRTQFSISFFIFALLFLLFDLEILLVYPYVVSAHTNGVYGLLIMLIFFLALTLGFAFELGKNALKIDSRQVVTLNNQNTNTFLFISAEGNKFYATPQQLNMVENLKNKVISLYKINSPNLDLYVGNSLNPYTLYINKNNIIDTDLESDVLSSNATLKQLHTQYTSTRDKAISTSNSEHLNLYLGMEKERIHSNNKKYNNETFPDKFSMELEKLSYLEFHAYNTPSISNKMVTPLTGTGNIEVTGDNIVVNFYKNWMISSFYLGLEANQLIPALMYANNKELYNSTSNLEKSAYVFWQIRQINSSLNTTDIAMTEEEEYYADLAMISGEGCSHLSSTLPINDKYIPDFTLDDIMLREILEDLTYVLLNLILAKTIIDFIHAEIDLNNTSSDMFFQKIETIIAKHYSDYTDEYKLLSSLRRFLVDNHRSIKDLNLFKSK